MGNNYYINLNPKEPSREEIQHHQDFDSLLAKYQSEEGQKARSGRIRSLYRYGGSIAAALAALLAFFFLRPTSDSSYQEQAGAYFAAQGCVEAPLASVKAQYNNFQIDANQGGIYEYPNGSRLVVPHSAFMNDRGELVQGEVSIHYRELQDYVDFFVAGIPMVYDSAGTTFYLESAGMVEIFAEQNGQRLQMAPGKYLDVELVSVISVPDPKDPPRYNVYQLDTAARNWVFQDIDRIQVLGEETPNAGDPLYAYKKDLADDLASIDQEVQNALDAFEKESPRPRPPLRPRRSEAGQPTLELDLDENQVVFAGGARESILRLRETFGNVIWQVSPASPTYDERAFRVKWEQVRLNKINDWEYELNLIHGESAVRLLVNPVLSSNAYTTAMQAYEVKEAEYLADLNEWEIARASVVTGLEAAAEARREAARSVYRKQIASLDLSPEKAKAALTRRKVINRFQVKSFGFWNCDRPLKIPAATLQARFLDPQGQPFKDCTAYLASPGQNTVHRFLAAEGTPTPLPIDGASEYLLWIVTPDQQIAVAGPEAFQAIGDNQENHTFTMQPVDRELTSNAEVRKLLEF